AVPATFNTINKWAAGISDTFALGILNEAIGLELPIVVAPYAKASLAAHPAFNENLEKLHRWGVHVLPNEVIRVRAGEQDPGTDGTGKPVSRFSWWPVVEAVARSH
ncbi:MAG: flavoprotein, partial [Pseudonocardiaceae bacterium]